MYNNENNHHTHQPIDTEQFEIRRTVNARKDLVVVVSVASSQFTFQFHQDLQVVVVQTIGSDGGNVVYPVFRPPLNIKNVETSGVSLEYCCVTQVPESAIVSHASLVSCEVL